MTDVDVFMAEALEDPWFSKFHIAKVTPDFLDWWLGYYGTPGEYENEDVGVDEYFIRCAFALAGWLKGKDVV